jgi:O-antigen ligase
MGISLIGLMLAASRGCFLGLIAAALFMILRSPKRLRNLVVITLVLIPPALWAPASPLRRLLHPTAGDTDSSDRRLDLWRVGLNMVRENPLFGVGVGNYKILMDQYDNSNLAAGIAHNSYLEVVAELGVVGAFTFLGLLISAFRSAERSRKLFLARRNRIFADISLAVEAGLIAFVVSAAFLSAEYQKFLWLLIFLTISLPATLPLRKRKITQPEPVAEPRFALETRVGES